MNKQNRKETNEIADLFLLLAQVIGNYRLQNYATLSPSLKIKLRTYHKQFIDFADYFYAASAKIELAGVSPSMDLLTRVTSELKDSITKVKKVQPVLNFFGAATRLGASILSKHPLAILASLENFVGQIELLKS